MRNKVLLLLILLLTSALGYGQNTVCKVMSYNIWYANPDAGENTWENRRDGVANAVIDQKADIVGMQEVLFRQVADLEKLLPEYSWVGVGRDDGKQGGEFEPIFFNRERFDLVQSGNFWLSETPDSAGSLGWDAKCIRIATWVQLKDKNSGLEIFVFNTHFDHEGETARLESAKLLVKKIQNNRSMIDLDKLALIAQKKENENRKFFSRLKARLPKDLDVSVHQIHDDIFAEINCLDCANCCKTLGPRITVKDIERIAKFLRIKRESFVRNYLRVDEDGDFVFQNMPCPFLLTDNFCSVYDIRPKACAEYPHTDRRKFHQLFSLTLKNIPTCPAVYEIVEHLKVKYP